VDTWTPPNSKHPPPKSDEPPLHQAARIADHDSIRRLIAEGADINAEFDVGLDPGAYPLHATPLMVAAGSGDGASVETVKLLLSLGADPKRETDAGSAAVFASGGLGWNYKPGGDAERLRAVMEAGAPLPRDPAKANRCLCEAAALGDPKRLELLLHAGINPRGSWDPERARKSFLEMERAMERFRQSQPDFMEGMPESVRQSYAESGRKLNQERLERHCLAPSPYEIPLFRAAESGNAECVRMLLRAGADAQARDSSSRTAMYRADSPAVISELIEAGLPVDDSDQFGWTPLVNALSEGVSELPRIRALVAAGANVNGVHDRGYTVFMSAVGSERSIEVLRLLVELGANPLAVSDLGFNAFHAAVDVSGEANSEVSVRETLGYLKELGVDIEHRNGAGLTPLCRAVFEGTGITVRVLCELGADPNVRCRRTMCRDDTCDAELPVLLHIAQGWGVHQDVKCAALLEFGADPSVTDPSGCIPVAYAVSRFCKTSPEPDKAFYAFFGGLQALWKPGNRLPESRKDFVSSFKQVVCVYVEAFAATIPIVRHSRFDEQQRTEHLATIAELCAYEMWARLQQTR
jgi:ankyrin repeat protein